MIKNFAVRVLFKRGAALAEELLGKAIRHGMTIAGGALMQAGYATADDVSLMLGGAVALGGVLISVLRLGILGKMQ